MNIRLWKGLRWIVALSVAVFACSDEGKDDQNATGGDGGRGAVQRTQLEPGPGEVLIAVEEVKWTGELPSDRQGFEVTVTLANGSGALPAPLNPVLFSVRTDRGAEVLGRTDLSADDACAPDIAVGGEATRTCLAAFAIPDGELPTELIYRSDERQAKAEIEACSDDQPNGLCGLSQRCVDGTCRGRCHPSEPQGYCDDGRICIDDGEQCVFACSTSQPQGYCERGSCFEGRCDASCYYLRLFTRGCENCLADASFDCEPFDVPLPDAEGEEDECADCLTCALNLVNKGKTFTPCECRKSCKEGCFDQVSDIFGCLIRACAICVQP